MAKIQRICLDVDGVLVDFVSATADLLGHDPDKVLSSWVLGNYDLAASLGMSNDDIWRKIDSAGENFWANIRTYPWFDQLVELCNAKAAEVVLCTSPSLHHESASGKLRWIQQHFGPKFRNYLIGAPKHFCARPGAVLIDDSEHNCEMFREYGGAAILFPRKWNSGFLFAENPIGYVVARMDELLALQSPPKSIKHAPPVGNIEYSSGAVRSGDAEGTAYHLISPVGLRRVAETCKEGAVKYSPYNWEKGMPISDLMEHGIRHLFMYLDGDRTEDHLAHAAWNVLGAMHSEERWPHLNKGAMRPVAAGSCIHNPNERGT